MSKALLIGSRVRLAPRVWGVVLELNDTHALITWIKIRRVTERSYRMSFPVAEIMPDADPLAASVPWRLRYWLQDGHGAANDGLMSAAGNKRAMEWSTMSPPPP